MANFENSVDAFIFFIFRLIFVLISLIVVAHFHVVDLSNPLATKLVTSRGNVALILVFFDNIKQSRYVWYDHISCIFEAIVAQNYIYLAGSFSIGVLIILVLLVQLCVSIYSVIWPWVLRRTTWGKLMTNYAIGLDKIDIARGRSVPAPPYIGGASATLRRNLQTISGYILSNSIIFRSFSGNLCWTSLYYNKTCFYF